MTMDLLIASLALVDAQLTRLFAPSNDHRQLDAAAYRVDHHFSDYGVEKLRIGSTCLVRYRVRLDAYAPREPGGSESHALRIDTTTEIVFSSGSDVTIADFVRFVQTRGADQAWPYARELISGLSLRSGWPPVYLPVRPLPLTRVQDA